MELFQGWKVLVLIDTQYLTVWEVQSAELSHKSTNKQLMTRPLSARNDKQATF